MGINEKWMASPNYSSSRGPYNVAVFHTTEGAMTIESLGNWFANPSAGCSSHHGADQYSANLLGAYVYENHKAWTQGNANNWCLSLEMCAYASWSRDTWMSKPTLLNNAADWLRYICGKYGIPYTLLSDSQAQSGNVKGICQHVDFGSMGSGHHDAGAGFPIDEVIKRAKGGSSGSAPATGGILVSSGVAFDPRTGNQVIAYIDQQGKIRCNGGLVDPDSSAKSGVGLAISESGRKVITYTNSGGKICTYTQDAGSNEWGWADQGFSAK
jgi:N-acetylmuramoyl-L-alanine amidase-like protein